MGSGRPPAIPPIDYAAQALAVRRAFLISSSNFLLKLGATLLTRSATQLTDMLRTGAESLACLFSWIVLSRIARGRVIRFDYGYGKLENASSLVVAGALMVALALALLSAYERLRHPVTLTDVGFGLLVACYATAASWWAWLRARAEAKREGSRVLESQAEMFLGKTAANVCVVGSLSLAWLFEGRPWVVYADPLFSLVLAAVLGHNIYMILAPNVSELLDRSLEEELQLVILRELAASFEDYENFHGLRTRRTGAKVHIELFLEFAPDRLMGEVQGVIDRLRARIEARIPEAQVVIATTTHPLP